ncbi:MAG: hypothetical protein U0936_06530 [Planctomycetaceae bacterium]
MSVWNDAIYTLFWSRYGCFQQFLVQIIQRSAVARLIAHRISRGYSVPAPRETGAYCQARKLSQANSSSLTSLVELGEFDSQVARTGCGKEAAVFICSAERPFPCRIIRHENLKAYPKTSITKKQGKAFPPRASRSVDIIVLWCNPQRGILPICRKDKEKSACCVACGTFFVREMALGDSLMSNRPGSSCSKNAVWKSLVASIRPTARLISEGANDWDLMITSFGGKSRHHYAFG